MTATLSLNGTATAAERTAAARRTYLDSVAEGTPLSGAELGRRFDRSPQWGRALVAAVRAEGAETVRTPASDGFRTAEVVREKGVISDDTPGVDMAPERTDMAAPAEAPAAPERRPWWATAVTVLVALLAGAASYGHMAGVALEAGEPTAIAYGLPLTVDGLVVAALWAGRRGRWWLALGLAVSAAANVASAEPTLIGYAVAGWPPVALLGTHRLLHRPEPKEMSR